MDVGVHRGHINQDRTQKQAVLVIPVWRKEREKKKQKAGRPNIWGRRLREDVNCTFKEQSSSLDNSKVSDFFFFW